MRQIRLSRRAQSDLENIWLYTCQEFGDRQAAHYLDALEDGIKLLLDHPEIGRAADHIKAGYRALTKHHHSIYYTVSKSHINIIGVLHERMDPAAHL